MKRAPKKDGPLHLKPFYIRKQLQSLIEGYFDDIELLGEFFNQEAEWAPWRMLSPDQCIWQLGRLSEFWVHSIIPFSEVTAWDEGGIVQVLKTVGLSWAESDSEFSADYAGPRDFMTYGLIQMFERSKRLSGWYDDLDGDGPPPKPRIIPGRNQSGGEFDIPTFADELESFINNEMLEDWDYTTLEIQPGGWLKPLPSEIMKNLNIRSGYYRCPIPENISAGEVEKAVDHIKAKVPR